MEAERSNEREQTKQEKKKRWNDCTDKRNPSGKKGGVSVLAANRTREQ